MGTAADRAMRAAKLARCGPNWSRAQGKRAMTAGDLRVSAARTVATISSKLYCKGGGERDRGVSPVMLVPDMRLERDSYWEDIDGQIMLHMDVYLRNRRLKQHSLSSRHPRAW